MQKVGNSTQRFLSSTISCFILLPCSGMGCLCTTVPLEVSLPQHGKHKGCNSSGVSLVHHKALPFRGSSLYMFPKISLSTHFPHSFSPFSKYSSSHDFSCLPFSVSVSPVSLHFLPPAAAILPQTCLKRHDMWSSVWLKFWGIMDYFLSSRTVWNPLWPAQDCSCTPSTEDTLQPQLPNPDFCAQCIRASLPHP